MFNAYYVQILSLVGINIIMGLSLNLISGLAGQFSLGHAGFMAVGAYASAVLTTVLRAPLLSLLSFLPVPIAEPVLFLSALAFGGILAAVAGLLVGIPTLRLKGDYLAVMTLGFGEIIRVIILNTESIGGARGLGDIPEYAGPGWIFFFAALTYLVIHRMVRSMKGKALLAIRDDEIAAESIGIPTARYKILAFTIGAFFAGVGGGLFAHLFTYLHTNSFSFLRSVEFVAIIVLGGMGSLLGTVVAAALLTVLPELLRDAQDWRMIIYAALLICMMLFREYARKKS